MSDRAQSRMAVLLLLGALGACHALLPFGGAASSSGEARPDDASKLDRSGADRDELATKGRDLASELDGKKLDLASKLDGKKLDLATKLDGKKLDLATKLDVGASCQAWSPGWTCSNPNPTIECLAVCGGLKIICYQNTNVCYCYKELVPYSCTGIGGAAIACGRCEAAVLKGCCP